MNQAGLVGFLLTLATLNVSTATVSPPLSSINYSQQTVEDRLTRITTAIRGRENQLPNAPQSFLNQLVAIGWADGHGRDWVNGRIGGWGDGHGGGFANVNPWRNGWGDAGGFYNYRPGWVNGGFVNYRPGWVNSGGGGFLNRY
ncbi:GrrA/OscA1 family cyclophane-containing rSAM-modified RiPP [Fischerella sp. PCC 9605]|uniref:GrrA/OscA1 family cyclophane-containing rSAM-modified RiPP n=1 Tax=Fischerella sp. PCC 9605 TaxID=1173024 RepID=UPI0004AD9C87|nr:GrrA/OscA1 family cyclophane-containing rSAM-modified RiPP [Fischerella sp. PCC 9605]